MNIVKIVPFDEIDSINDVYTVNVEPIDNNDNINDISTHNIKPINDIIVISQNNVFLVNETRKSYIYVIFEYIYNKIISHDCNFVKVFMYYIMFLIVALIVYAFVN